MSQTPNPPQGEQYPQQNQPYPQQGYPQQPPKKKRKKWPWIVGILVLIVVLLFGGCAALVGVGGKAVNDAVQSESAKQDAAHEVVIKVTTSGGGNVSWGNAGSMSTEQVPAGDWSKTVQDVKAKDGFSASVTGDIQDQTSQVTCELVVDGQSKSTQSGSGAGGIANCTLPLDM